MTTTQELPRQKKQWWVIAEDGVRLVTGYSCHPNNPDYWWCPEVGSSLSEKYHLFTTEAAALDKFIGDLERLAAKTSEQLAACRLQRSRL